MFERLNERARRVMSLAELRARNLNHEYIGVEHILLGLIDEDHGVAANVLEHLVADAGSDLDAARKKIAELQGELDKWTTDPNYRYAESGPIHRNAIICRDNEINTARARLMLIALAAGYDCSRGFGSEYEKLISFVRTLAEHNRGLVAQNADLLRQLEKSKSC